VKVETVPLEIRTMVHRAELLVRYKHLRKVGLELNAQLVKTLSRSVLDEGGRKLGILEQNVLTLDSEDEIAVLMDYCIHNVRRHGVTAIEQYLAEFPPAPESDELVLLQALRQARYSLFTVEETEPGVGIQARDLLRDEPLFLVDVGLSRTASVGIVFAARVMAPEGIGMTTGTALPIGEMSPVERGRFLDGLKHSFPGMDFGNLSPEEAGDLAAVIIDNCLQHGAAKRIEYLDPGQLSSRNPVPQALPSAQRIGRNDPCPCGSGKKFKRCCGARET